MNILNKFTIKSLKLNKKRTIVTIIGIMLSTALICGVAGLVSSFQNSLIDWARTNDGNYHVTFKNVESNKAQYVRWRFCGETGKPCLLRPGASFLL